MCCVVLYVHDARIFNKNSLAQKWANGIPLEFIESFETLHTYIVVIILAIEHAIEIYIYSHYQIMVTCVWRALTNYSFFFYFRFVSYVCFFCLVPTTFFLSFFLCIPSISIFSLCPWIHSQINFLLAFFFLSLSCVLRFFCFRRQIK